MRRLVWMAITNDELALPLAIADSAKELAEICGTTDNVVRSTAYRAKNGETKAPGYIKVEIEEDEHEKETVNHNGSSNHPGVFDKHKCERGPGR